MKNKRNAIIITALIILLFAVSVCAIYLIKKSAGNDIYAAIYQNNRLVKTIDLTKVRESYSFTVTGDNGCYNVIEVRNGSIGITESSCPDGLCQDMGFISDSLIPIVCLPNHIVINLTDETGSDNIDGISY